MRRRAFIKLSVQAVVALAVVGGGTPLLATESSEAERIVLNMILDGGPDFRHLIVPAYDEENDDKESYAVQFWEARASLFSVSTAEELKEIYRTNYDEVSIDGVTCGILKKAGWLTQQIKEGNVAIVSNVIGSTNRDHTHSMLMIESGQLDIPAFNRDVSGWLGRGADRVGENVVSVTSEVRLSCNGPHPSDPQHHSNHCVFNNFDSREIALYLYDTQADLDAGETRYKYDENAILSRALRSYYTAKQGSIETSSPYYKAMQQEKELRLLGDKITSVLSQNPLPDALVQLSDSESENCLDSAYFAKQIGAVYDSFLTRDILNMGFISMEYTGWDSHKNLLTQIEPKFEDMFGQNRGFDALVRSLNEVDSTLYENMVMVFSGEFGRQHRSNGDHGNDHGRGNALLLIGGGVQKGGLYGELFPQSEIGSLTVKNADIEGRTSMLKVYASVLDWKKSGLSEEVFDGLSTQKVESGVALDDIFTA